MIIFKRITCSPEILESRYNLKKAGFDFRLASAGVTLQDLRKVESQAAEEVAKKQDKRALKWTLSRDLAEIDSEIAQQQLVVVQDHTKVVEQEGVIAGIQNEQASDMATFLATKFTNAELYEWMSGVLGGIYRYFLQQATVMARLAQVQLAFERQDAPGKIVQEDYWEVPSDPAATTSDSSGGKDRRGLTGSARLLEDIYKLRLIKRVRTSVVALIPPTAGVRASLTLQCDGCL